MTPETLRELADLLERPTKDGARLAREGMRAAADAWENDVSMIGSLERMLDGAVAQVDDLRKRLEEATWLLENCEAAFNDVEAQTWWDRRRSFLAASKEG